MSYQQELEQKQSDVVEEIEDKVLDGEPLDVVWNLTLAANLISANVQYGKIREIEKLDGVARVIVETPSRPLSTVREETEPQMATSSEMTGANRLWESGYTGAGSRVAIIDTGIDYQHRSFDGEALMYSLGLQEAEKPDGWLDSLELLDEESLKDILPRLNIYTAMKANKWDEDDVYYSAKVPFAFNYGDISVEVDHSHDTQGEHGSHVAGIAAANAYVPAESKDGFEKALDAVKVQGVAPDAQLLVMKVFGRAGSGYDSDYMAAIEDAFYLGANVVNLSLGTPQMGFSRSEYYQELLDELTDAGLIIAASAGNEGGWADNEAGGAGSLRVEDVSMNTVSSPASYTDVLSVASSDNRGMTDRTVDVGGEKFTFYDGGSKYGLNSVESVKGPQSYVMIDGIGSEDQFNAVASEVNGKLAVCMRGDIDFSQKANNAMGAGAIGLIVVNTENSLLNMDLSSHGDYTNPCFSVTSKCGEALRKYGEKKTVSGVDIYEGTLTVNTDVTVVENVGPDAMSSFSAWGVPGSLELKPEITAPGGNIYSVNGAGDTHDAYENMSGTSMASPQIAGMTALMAQYIRENHLEEKTDLNAGQLVNSLLMSTAVPITVDGEDGVYYPVLQQGAGLANVGLATQSSSYITMDDSAAAGVEKGKVKAELGEDAGKTGEYSFGFTLSDLTGQTEEYELRAELFTQDVFTDGEGTVRLSGGTRRLLSTADFQVTGAGFTEAPFVCDLDGDGDTDNDDALMILAYAAGNVDGLDGAADLNGDGTFTTEDAYLFLVKLGTKTLTLENGGSAHVTATLRLDDSAREYLDATYPNGAYIEGYVFVTPGSTEEGVALPEHSIPVLGFYGSWSDAPMFDSPTYVEALYGIGESSYMGVNTPEIIAAPADDPVAQLYTSNYIGIRQFGERESSYWSVNPYLIEDTPMYGRAAINSRSLIYSIAFSLIRNAAQITLFVKDGQGNVVEAEEIAGQYPGGFPYTQHDGTVLWDYIVAGLSEIIASPSGMGFSEGESFTVGVLAVPEYYEQDGELTVDRVLDMEKDGSLGDGACMSWTFTVDDTAPTALSIAKDEDGNLVVNAQDNMAIAAVVMMNSGGTEIIDAQPVEQSGGRGSVTFDLSSFESGTCKILVGDYAGNEKLYDVSLKTEDEPEEDFGGQMFGFTAGYRYGVANSWLRIDPDKLNFYNTADRGVETVAQSTFTVTAAEYVGGYVYMAAGDGNMYVARQGRWSDPVLLGSYKDSTDLVRDMAYNYTNGILYALGDKNTVFRVNLSTGELTEDYKVSITCPADGTDDNNTVLVTLAIDDEGNFYSVNSGYSVSAGGFTKTVKGNPQWTFLYKWGAENIENGEIANLSPVSNESTGNNFYSSHLYGSPDYPQNVFQAMAWDHDKDVLYWASGDEYTSTYSCLVVFRNPASGKAELLRTEDDNSGLTSSQIPGLYIVPKNDDTRIPEAESATSVKLSRDNVELLEGASVTLTADVFPWNLGDKSLKWTSDNESSVTVKNGVVKAVKAGSATVTAASAVSGEVKATCTVTVKELPNIEFSALLTKADGTSAWIETSTKDLGSWTQLSPSASYIAGTLLDDTIYVHDGDRIYAVDADNFSVRPLTNIDLTWNWPDAAPAPLSTDLVLDGQDTAFGRIVGLVDGIDGGTSIAVMNPEKGTGDDMATRSQFYDDRAAVIAYKGSGTQYANYLDCPSREYYLLTESGELWKAVIWETYDEWSYGTLIHDCELTDIGPTGIDLGGVSTVYGGQSASMLYDQDSGCLLVSVCLDGRTDKMYIVDPNEASAVELGAFAPGVAPVVALYQYDRISELTVKVRPAQSEIYVGETVKLTASVYPTDMAGEVTWSSDRDDVAEVDADGVVTGKSAGTAVITATYGDASASCTVTVKGLATAPAGATANAYIVKPDGSGAWVTIDLSSLTFYENAQDDRAYSGAAAYDGGIYAMNGIWLTRIDGYSYSVDIGDALPAGTQILDGTCVYGEPVTLRYFDEEWYVQTKEDVQVPGGVVYVTGDDWIMFVDDYTDANTAHGSVLEGYDAAAITWYGNKISRWDVDGEYDEDSYIQEWFVLGADGYLWKVFRRTYVDMFGDVYTTPVSDIEQFAELGVEFADRTKVSMTRVKGDGYDGLLISDAADRNGTALYWLELTEDLAPASFGKLGILEGVSDLAGLYTEHDLSGDFVDTTTIGGGEGGGDIDEDNYDQGYDAGSEAVYSYSVPYEYEELCNERYREGYYDGYDEGYYTGYEDFSGEGYDLNADEAVGIDLEYYGEGGYYEGFSDGVYDAAYDNGHEIGWSEGYDKGSIDAEEGLNPNPIPPEDVSMFSLENTPETEALASGFRVMSAAPKTDAGTVMASGGDVSLSGSVSGTSVTAKIELSASTNGLVTVKYDPEVLTFQGVSGSGRVLRAFKIDSEAGTVTVAYAASGAFTGEALRVSFSYSTGMPDTKTTVSLSASQLGGTVYGEDEEKGQVELALPYVPTPVPTPSVTTGDKTQDGGTTTETTAVPDASVNNGEATSKVTDSMGSEIVKQAEENGSDTVVVAPKISGDVSKTEVTISGKTVTDIAERTDAALKVETPVGSVTLPGTALPELGKAGDVAVSVEKTEETVSVQVSAGGDTVNKIPGGVKASFELKDGEVAVIVSQDGAETVVPKSLVENGRTYVLLDGSAAVKIITNSKSFEDVDAGAWFGDAVAFSSSHELLNGTGETTFEPESDMTRAMLTTVLWRLESEAASEGAVAFPDVNDSTGYAEGISWAADAGIITGTDKGVFEPEREVTRQEMAMMLYRYAVSVGMNTAKTGELTAFTDAADVADWASDAMKWAVSSGIFSGDGSGHLNPTASASRAQVALAIRKLVALMVK